MPVKNVVVATEKADFYLQQAIVNVQLPEDSSALTRPLLEI
jgi:hypothetical protein